MLVTVEPLELTVGTKTYNAGVNVQGERGDVGVVILPGAGHGPKGDIFDIISYELAGADKMVLRYDSWESRDELEQKTLGKLQEELDAAVDHLESEGASTIYVLAKSFGGGLALSHVPDAVDRILLWAPAVSLGRDSGEATALDEKIGAGDDILINIQNLGHVDVPVRILRGTEDQGVSLESCNRIVEAVKDGELTEIPGEDHSFNKNRTAVVEQTLAYLAA